MTKRADIFLDQTLAGLYVNHPQFLLLQKEDWKEYLVLLASIYDPIEEGNTKVPFEVIRAIATKFFSQRRYSSLENKITNFFSMAIGELKVLKDSHDQLGQRYIETTRHGKELLQFIEGLLTQRTRFSGTGAETLLAALNQLLAARQQMTKEQALTHHKQKIKSYQQDIERIQNKGLEYAELLPIPHSNEALFSQAEEAATHILSSVEDVKTAIERQRQEMAEEYFESSLSAGKKLNAVVEFYEGLYRSSEYVSYVQAKNLLSFVEGLSTRFQHKNIDHLVHHIKTQELVDARMIQRSQLKGFSSQFHAADNSIQEKIKSQLRLLQQQVAYAMTQDMQGLQKSLKGLLSSLFSHRDTALAAFEMSPVEVELPTDFDHGDVALYHFEVTSEMELSPFALNQLDIEEQKALFEALLAAEEATLQSVLEKFRSELQRQGRISLEDYEITLGLAEYYVLSEIEIFSPGIRKELNRYRDINIHSKFGDFVLLQSPCYIFYHEVSQNGSK